VQIKQLEEEIGVALFIRSKRHVEITRPGKVFLKTAREALAMLDRSVTSARRAERGEVGTLRLGFVATAMFNILPRLLEELTQLPNLFTLRDRTQRVCDRSVGRTPRFATEESASCHDVFASTLTGSAELVEVSKLRREC
jgi:DNA-binding transcriptional LysR family regulator